MQKLLKLITCNELILFINLNLLHVGRLNAQDIFLQSTIGWCKNYVSIGNCNKTFHKENLPHSICNY